MSTTDRAVIRVHASVNRPIWDRDILNSLAHLGEMGQAHPVNQVALRTEWEKLFALSQRYTPRERVVTYYQALGFIVGRFPLLEYIVLYAVLDLESVLRDLQRAAIHGRLAGLLDVHPELMEQFDDDTEEHLRLATTLRLRSR